MPQIFPTDKGFTIYLTSIQEELEINEGEARQRALQIMYMGGGIFLNHLDENAAKIFSDTYDKDVPEGPMLIVLKDFVVNLSKEEVDAIYYHELGHLELGHLASVDKTGDLHFHVNDQFELEADQYALRFTTKEIFLSALTKLLDNNVTLLENYYKEVSVPYNKEEVYKLLFENELTKKRFAAMN